MRYLWKHIEAIIKDYDGSIPLAHFLKAYHKKFPILGSRDRRAISDAAYAYYRCGKAFPAEADTKEKLLAALELTGKTPKIFSEELAARDMKLAQNPEQIFPFRIAFSQGIDKEQWVKSLLRQPRLFLRMCNAAAEKLSASGIAFERLSGACLALPNGTKAETILAPDDYWIMDASSQKTGDYFRPQKGEAWWDCCAGAGGKSLLLKHLEAEIKLTVSDVRKSILQNLKMRFQQYHLPPPESIVTDVSEKAAIAQTLAGRSFDAIICDTPCTGSGTWARTPEGAYFFKEESLAAYAKRQKAILANAAEYLKPGGRIIYITCSVFEGENEAVVAYALNENPGLRLESCRLINGIDIGADCLFVAVLRSVDRDNGGT